MEKVIQEAIIKVIQPKIVHYFCDGCGLRCGTKDNPKETWCRGNKNFHYCKRTKCSLKDTLNM